MTTYITKMFDRLDRICFDRYGATTQSMVEWLLEQNPGIELYGILLPVGILINLPDPPKKVLAAPVIKQVFLWN